LVLWVWAGLVWFGFVSFGLVWSGLVWCAQFSSGLVLVSWRTAWKGRVIQGLEMLLQKSSQQVIAVAIEGGRHCHWEQQQIAPGGDLSKLFPDVILKVFSGLTELRLFS